MVFGDGCRRCVAGDECSFSLLLLGPGAKWQLSSYYNAQRPREPSDPLKWDVMVRLAGPAMGHAEVASVTPEGRLLRATYQLWDPGNYM